MSKKPSLRQLRAADSAQRLSTSLVSASSDTWQAWFDGGALPNPGKIGIGVLLISPDGVRHEHAQKTALNGCSNEAELHAMIAAMKLALAATCRRLILCGDSQVAIRYVMNQEHTQIARLLPLIAAAQKTQLQFDAIELRWVPRHRNTDADRLSRAALGLLD